MSTTYLRDDIYYCPGCGLFYDIKTDAIVEVDLSTIPVGFALEVMADRQAANGASHATVQTKRRPRKAKRKGFGTL